MNNCGMLRSAFDSNERTRSKERCLLDSSGVRGPPDVPPRNNPTMSRLNGRITGNPADLGDFEPSCLVRTPSGNVYIPSGDIQKNSSMDYKSNSSCSSPSKDKSMSGMGMGSIGEARCMPYAGAPVLPLRNNLRRPPSSHFSPTTGRFHFRKGLTSKCSWKCTAITFITLSITLISVLSYISLSNLVNWSYQNTKACAVLVDANVDNFSTSKALESNKSLNVRPKPSGSTIGAQQPGNDDDPRIIFSSRYRRDISLDKHASSTQSSVSTIMSPVEILHENKKDLVESSMHDIHTLSGLRSNTSPNAKVNFTSSLMDFVNISVTTPTGLLQSASETNNDPPFLMNNIAYNKDSGHNETEPKDTKLDSNISGTKIHSAAILTNNNEDIPLLESPKSTNDLVNNTNSFDEMMQQDDGNIFTFQRGNNDDTSKYNKHFSKLLKDYLTNENIHKTYEDHNESIKLDKKVLNSAFDTNKKNNTDIEYSNYNTDNSINITNEDDNKIISNIDGSNNIEVDDKSKSFLQSFTTNQKSSLNSDNIGNRVVLNLTISSEEYGMSKSKPLYVVSIFVPTDNKSGYLPDVKINPVEEIHNKIQKASMYRPTSKIMISTTTPLPPTTLSTTTSPEKNHDEFIGGQCSCSCPSCDDISNSENFTDSFYEDYSDENFTTNLPLNESTNKTNKTTNDRSLNIQEDNIESTTDEYTETTPEIASTTDFQETSETSITEMDSTEFTSDPTTTELSYGDTLCPEMVTYPPPPILILEGARTFPARSFPPDGTTFSQISFGQKLSKEIQPYSYWNMQFYQSEAAYIKFDYNIPRGASIGVYARRNALPTHTQYHILEVLSGFKARITRASQPSVKKEVTHYMEQGHWFLSLYNDDGDPQEVSFVAVVADDMTHNCPNGCSGNGECLMGHCQCNPGFGGDDCSESVCPVLCSQKGEYINGECQCNPGWKGKECSLRHDECEVPDCNGHGHCVNGKCACIRGYKGKFCAEIDCPHPTCSGHGFCIEGSCFCKKGWKGTDCGTMDKDALQCLPDCSGHGTFDLDTQSCTCEARWSGDDCSKEVCDLDCGQHGFCVGESCQCNPGWSGESCSMKLCDARCSEHGQCKNGTCLCVSGWNGKHCTIEGCPAGCGGHGTCKAGADGLWECKCFDGWDGPDCSTLKEQNCNDNKDNDKDGLIDCEDPECCSNSACSSSQLCVSAPTPIEILLRKQPPAITASFFERMKFLIDEDSLQNYARLETFNESRVGVVRGRVVTAMGFGIVGVRVSTTTPLEGFTLTRESGWFELLVNGGGAVTLLFGRSPFKHTTFVVYVPWNEVVIIDKIVMSLNDDKPPTVPLQACLSHDYDVMKPVVLATWKHGFQGGCPDKSAILAESQVVQERLRIPGTGLNLVYHSSRAAGYLSTIQLQLTPDVVPQTLMRIHLRITIEGILFEKIFEADPVIKFTYAWNRLNVYRQRIYGVTTAIVKVGYQYSDCKDIIWHYQTTKLSGHDMSISDIGGWNLDVQHRYNFHEGILQKGDGSNIYLKHKPRVILTTMGDGHQRPLECADTCEGPAFKQRLLAPVALAASPDGSLFVGDFNLIRKILTDGTVKTLVKLNATRVSYRYHMALSPLDDILYISDPESHQIIAVRNLNDFSDPEHNWEVIVGSGERCLPGDEAHCGDGALARDAKLAYPKGMAVSTDNVLYFADGTNIRMVDRDGIVTTIIGNHMHKSHWKPIPCEGTLNVEEVHLRWPTELAISPLDNTLHIIDDHMILQLTPDGRIRVVAGRPLHCPSPLTGFDVDLAAHATLIMPQSIGFGPTGDLYVAESDSQRINRVRVITTDGKISPYAGAESKCNCLERGCDCFEADHYLASSSKFNTISAVVVSPDGIVHIGDQANYRIRSVLASIPDFNNNREYEIYSPETQEIYIFNRFGQHTATRNILTGEIIYLFAYNVNTSNGKLNSITDATGNKVFVLRDYASQVNSIENTKGQKSRLRMSRMKMLLEFSTPENYNVTFDYHGPTGLLKTKLDSTGRSHVYNYDEFGRLTSAVTPTGKIISLNFDLSLKGASVQVNQNNHNPASILIKGSSVITKIGDSELRTTSLPDGSISTILPWGHTVSTDTVPYSVLAEIDPLLGESYPVPAKQKIEVGDDLANRFEWRYFLRRTQNNKGKSGKTVSQTGRKLRVNGENLLTFEYDRDSTSVAVFIDERVELLNVTYDKSARPIRWGPRNGIFAGVELEYDRFSRLNSWKWGELTETYGFDRAGRLFEIKYGDGSSMIYTFKDLFSGLPLKVTTPRGSDYLLQYDDAGALQSLTTPRGHIHAFFLQTSFGFYKYQYFSPMNRHPYEILYNDEGKIVSKIYPHQSGKIAYIYDNSGKLETTLAGLSSIHYTYMESSQLIKSIEVLEPNYNSKQEFKYHAGIMKDEKIKFTPKSGLSNAHFKYQYDGNARLSTVEVNINGKELPTQRIKYNQNTGILEAISDLRIYSNTFNRSVMQDTSKQFFTITDYDDHGRIKTLLINIKSYDVFRIEVDYDLRNRIKTQKITIGRSSYTDRITYNSDGHVVSVAGNNEWKYVYDENGNIIGIIHQDEKVSLGYDSGDRIVQYGDVEFNSYDDRGFVVRRGEHRYRYNSRGQLIHALERDKFQTWYFYDDRGRLASWKDDKDNVTQYFYSNPMSPDQPTHLHYPKTGKTFRFLYDQRDILITVETTEQRFYVACDQNGSPMALFDTNGNVIKEIKRSPFGKIIIDSNPDFYLPIDFHGGIIDPHTKLIHLNRRLYDPLVGQWMTPSWEHLSTKLKTPLDIFVYRFNNNDPMNKFSEINYMTDMASWLKLYGYDLDKMIGSKYTESMIYRPMATMASPQLAPDFGVISGLQCINEKINDKFSDLNFVPVPLLKTESRTRNLLPRVAYRKAVFGEGLLISRMDGRALVSVVDGVNSVVQDVVTSVFNNSFFLDLHFNIHDQDVFYFVKDNPLKVRDDMEELKRLGGMYNVSQHDGGDQGVEIRLHGAEAAVVLKYGVDPLQERSKLIKHAHKRAVEKAWEHEKALIAAGWEGRAQWTEEEKEELIAHGIVDGWTAEDIHSTSTFPQLADDPGNIAFIRDSRRKRRKSVRTHRRKL